MPTNRVAALRKAAGLKQRELAAEIGVDPITISRWERGATSIPDQRKLELAELFGVPVAHLLGWDSNGDGNPNPRSGRERRQAA